MRYDSDPTRSLHAATMTITPTAPIDDDPTDVNRALARAASFREMTEEIGEHYVAAARASSQADAADHLRIARVLAAVAQAEIDLAVRANGGEP